MIKEKRLAEREMQRELDEFNDDRWDKDQDFFCWGMGYGGVQDYEEELQPELEPCSNEFFAWAMSNGCFED